MWVLVIFWLVTEHASRPAIDHIPGFPTREACSAAAMPIQKLKMGSSDIAAACIVTDRETVR